jgi:hypothetical protein
LNGMANTSGRVDFVNEEPQEPLQPTPASIDGPSPLDPTPPSGGSVAEPGSGLPNSWDVGHEKRPPRRRGRVTAASLGLLAIAAALMVKFVVPLVLGGVAASAMGSLFGGPWDRLPSDTQSRLEHRFDAAMGNRLKGLSDADQATHLEAMLTSGLPRLDDQTLIRRFQIESAGLDATDEKTCAAFAQEFVKGHVTTETSRKVLGSLDPQKYGEWIEINLTALEAESKGAPPQRVASQADTDAMSAALVGRVPANHLATMQALDAGGAAVLDAASCSAARAVYAAGLGLDPKTLATLVRVEVSP